MGDLCSEPSRQITERLHRIGWQGVHDGAEWNPRVGKKQVRRKLQKRNRHERAGLDVRMGKLQRIRGKDLVTVEKEIQVQGSRTVAIIGTCPPQRAFDPLQQSSRLEWTQRVTHL